MKHPVALTLFLSAAWLLWSGHFSEGLLLGLGAASVALVVWMTWRMRHAGEDDYWPFGARLVTYIPWLLWQIFLSNLAVARIILSPRLPIDPRLIRVPAGQQTTIGQATYANSITLTPGTVTLDLRDGQVLVHALTGEFAASLEEGEMDRRVTRLERLR